MKTPRPPRTARALLDRLRPPLDRGAATGDLDEEYARYVRPERGRLRADLWYWRQVLLSVPAFSGASFPAHGLGGELRQALRVLRRRPTFAISVVATLALALGLGTAVFSIVHAVLLTPLPYASPDRIVRPVPNELFFVNSFEAVAFAERMTTLESTAAWSRELFLFDEGQAEEVRGARVSWNHFDLLGAVPGHGRTFLPDDASSGTAIVLGHGLWVRRFGADPAVVGGAVRLNGEVVTVVGVLGPEHVPLEFDWEAWSPMPLDPAEMVGRGMVVNGRLRDGVTLEQSRAEMRGVLGDLWSEGGAEVTAEDRATMRMVTIEQWLLGDVRSALTVVGAAVVFLLLLACANVANLFIAQSESRAREFAVRSALGGSRFRVSRQIAIEVVLLSALGGIVGFVAAASSLGWLVGRLPPDLPRLGQVGLSGGPALYAAVGTLLAASVVGLIPMLRPTGLNLGWHLGGGRGSSASRPQLRLRSSLVSLEVALAVLLIAGASLMMRSLLSLQRVETGFDSERIVTLRPSPPADRYPLGAPLEEYYAQLTRELERLPGVRSVGAIQFLPMTSGGWWEEYRTEADLAAESVTPSNTAVRVVREGYFETMGIRLLRGRLLTRADFAEDAPSRGLVNEALADEIGSALLGRNLYLGDQSLEVVGVVENVRQSDLRTESHGETYVPFAKAPWRRMHMVMSIDGDAGPTIASARDAVSAIDPAIAFSGPTSMKEIVARTMGRTTLIASLLTLFGVVGLALGGVGVYGVAAQSVAERTREIGIRMALGADGGRVVTRTVLRGLFPVLVGLTAGVVSALGAGRLLDGLLHGVAPNDLATLVATPMVLMVVALGALAIPAVRAGRVDPVRTLRE